MITPGHVIAVALVLLALAGSLLVVVLGLRGGFKGSAVILLERAERERYERLGETPEERSREFVRLVDAENSRRVAASDAHWMRASRRGGPP